MIPTLVIFARESLEASLIIAIIASYLKQIGQTRQMKKIWIGTLFALIIDGLLGYILFTTIHAYSGTPLQAKLEGTTYFLAAFILLGMSFWMKKQSRQIKKRLQKDIDAAISQSSSIALSALAFITIGREGLETMVFMLAIAFSTAPFSLFIGAVLGLAIGITISWATYRLGKKVPLGQFLNVLGILLLLFASGLFTDGIRDYQSVHWISFGAFIVWDTNAWLKTSSFLGGLLHSLFGYSASPTILQASGYIIFLILSLFFYLKKPPQPPSRQSQKS